MFISYLYIYTKLPFKGMKDEAALLKWLTAVRNAVATAPAKTLEHVKLVYINSCLL